MLHVNEMIQQKGDNDGLANIFGAKTFLSLDWCCYGHVYTHTFCFFLLSPSLVSWFPFINSVMCSVKLAQFFCKGNGPTDNLVVGLIVVWWNTRSSCTMVWACMCYQVDICSTRSSSAAQTIASALALSLHLSNICIAKQPIIMLSIADLKKGVMVSWSLVARQRYMIAPPFDIKTPSPPILDSSCILCVCTDNLFNNRIHYFCYNWSQSPFPTCTCKLACIHNNIERFHFSHVIIGLLACVGERECVYIPSLGNAYFCCTMMLCCGTSVHRHTSTWDWQKGDHHQVTYVMHRWQWSSFWGYIFCSTSSGLVENDILPPKSCAKRSTRNVFKNINPHHKMHRSRAIPFMRVHVYLKCLSSSSFIGVEWEGHML